MKLLLTRLLIFSSLLFTVSCEKEKANKPPVVTVGSNRTVILTGKTNVDTIHLEGSAKDVDGSVIAYIWSQVSGPNTALLHNPGSRQTAVSNLVNGTYVFQLMATDNDGATGVKSLSIIIKGSVLQELVLRPGPTDAQSCIVATREGPENHPFQTKNGNQNHNTDINASAWTYGSQGLGTGINRTYFKFNSLSSIPSTAEIVSAKLSLYGLPAGKSESSPQGNSTYPGSPYSSYGLNVALLKRVTGDWNGTTITWNNKPGTTATNQVEVPASDKQWNYNVVNLDVTNLVKDMVSSSKNYGFCMELKSEVIYKSLVFGSSKTADSTVRPRLVIVYHK